QTIHILALSALFGAALIVSLRFLGKGFSGESASAQVRRFSRIVLISVLILLTSGSLLIIAEPGRTIRNPAFYTKMSLLVVALGITAWLRRRAPAAGEHATGSHRAVAALAMLLWVAIIVAGRYIAYIT